MFLSETGRKNTLNSGKYVVEDRWETNWSPFGKQSLFAASPSKKKNTLESRHRHRGPRVAVTHCDLEGDVNSF